MKILAIVEEYAERPIVRIDWRQAQFFRDGEGPRPGTMITLELSGFQGELHAEEIVKWLTKEEKRGLRGFFKKSREVHEFSRHHWKEAELDDLLDAVNGNQMVWRLADFFSAKEMVAFEKERLPEAWKLFDDWEKRAFGSEEKRFEALREIEKDFAVRHTIVTGATKIIEHTLTDYETRRDEEALAKFLGGNPRDLKKWITQVEQLTSVRGSLAIAAAFGKFVNEEAQDSQDLMRILEKIHSRTEASEQLTWKPGFWKPFERRLVFPANVDAKEIDISRAVEVVVPAHFDLFEATRVGNIIPGRRALWIAGVRRRGTYIKGGRALQFDVMKAGGRLQKYGCTLIDPRGSMQGMLREAEELILLANLDPEQALKKVEDLEIPPDHPIHEAAEKARDDYRFARILADLLIELKTGVDAAVVRGRLGM